MSTPSSLVLANRADSYPVRFTMISRNRIWEPSGLVSSTILTRTSKAYNQARKHLLKAHLREQEKQWVEGKLQELERALEQLSIRDFR